MRTVVVSCRLVAVLCYAGRSCFAELVCRRSCQCLFFSPFPLSSAGALTVLSFGTPHAASPAGQHGNPPRRHCGGERRESNGTPRIARSVAPARSVASLVPPFHGTLRSGGVFPEHERSTGWVTH